MIELQDLWTRFSLEELKKRTPQELIQEMIATELECKQLQNLKEKSNGIKQSSND